MTASRFTVTCSSELLEKIERVRGEYPTLLVTRTDAIRSIMERGVDSIDDHGLLGPSSRPPVSFAQGRK